VKFDVIMSVYFTSAVLFVDSHFFPSIEEYKETVTLVLVVLITFATVKCCPALIELPLIATRVFEVK
jgi:hypothetical protein